MALLVQAMILTPEQFTVGWNDQGSTMDQNIQSWRPNPPQGWHPIGDIVESNVSDSIYGSQPRGPLLVLRDISTEGDVALVPLTAFTKQWDSDHTGANDYGSVWGENPPANYVGVGSIVMDSRDDAPPSNVYMAVHASLLLRGQVGANIWTASNTIRNMAFSVWAETATPRDPSGIPFGSFVATTSLDAPYQEVFTLNPAFVQWVPNTF